MARKLFNLDGARKNSSVV
jgi:hypothetical protein